MNTFPVIVKSNELIEARYKLSLNQQRLVLLLISIIKPEDEDFQDYQLKVSDFAAMFGIKNCKAIYSEVEQAAAELVGKVINLRQGRERECVAWLSYGKYRQGEGVITIRFDKSLKPYLLQLKSHFTRYQLNTVVKFKSQYSIRLYELLKEFEYLGHGGAFYRIIGIEELKGLFGINNGEYEKMHDLKKRVIDPSVPAEHVEALLNLGIAGATAKQWAKQYGKKKIMAACGYVAAKLETAAIKDLPAYLAKTLEHDYHLAWMKENQEKQAKKADETERKAGEEAAEQQRRQAAIQKIHDTLSAFHALREGEQDAWRDRFEAEYHSLTMKHWKKYRKEGRQPEDNKMFSGVFSEFFDSMQAV
jgi:hypothetical protein